MKKANDKNKEHPEIQNIKNICDISFKTKQTKDVCNQVNKNKSLKNNKK